MVAKAAIQPIGQAGIEINLNNDGHGEHDDNERLLDDGFALKGEQQYQREQQCGVGERVQHGQGMMQCCHPAACQ